MKIKTYNKISKKGLNLFPVNYEVGDALKPRKIQEAVFEAYGVAAII